MATEGKWLVFETPDAGEEEQASEDALAEERRRALQLAASEDVVVDPLPPPEQVFEVFAARRYVGTASEPEVVGRRSDVESPFERYNRLRTEVDELVSDLRLSEQEDPAGHSKAFEELAKGALALRGTLSELEADQGLSSLVSETPGGAEDAAAAAALNEARTEALREQLGAAGQTQGAPVGVEYKLFYSAEQNATVEHASAVSLMERVARLEALVGVSAGGSGSAGVPLARVVAQLEDKVALLDEGKLSILAQKAKSLGGDVEQVSRLRRRRSSSVSSTASATGGGAPDADLPAVVEKIEACNAVAAAVPGLVERLASLQEIHRHNASLHMRLDGLDKLQSDLERANELDRELLENLKASMLENMETVQANLAQLKT